MTGPYSTDPVARFLSPGARQDGPFGVLGLPLRELDEAEIIDAVHRAMERIDAHPESRTPSADEARLAIHAAAANLLDGEVRRELLRRLRAPIDFGVDEPETRPAPPPPRVSPAMPESRRLALEADALRCVAGVGGWNRAAMDRFLRLAHLRGVTTEEALGAIRHLWPDEAPPAIQTTPPPAIRPPAPAPSPMPEPEEEPEPPPAGLSARGAAALILTVLLLMVAGASFALWLVDSAPAVAPAPPPAPSVARVDAPPPAEEPASKPPTTGARPLDNAPAILHELEVAGGGLALDVEASIAVFERAAAAMADRWTDFTPGDLLAATDSIVTYLYRVSGQRSLSERVIASIEAGAGGLLEGRLSDGADIRRGVWSMGMLVRLRREQNLPGGVIRRIDQPLLRAPGGLSPTASTFRAGSVAALRAMAPLLADADRALWEAWLISVRAATLGDEPLKQSLLLGAVESILRGPAVPRAPGEDAVAVLIAELSWRPDAPARPWLLRAFDDRTLDAPDLHRLTLALATRSRADGVDASMILPASASEFTRRELRDRFRAAWGLDDKADQSETLMLFTGFAVATLEHPAREGGVDDLDRLAEIVRLARLNASASLLWRGEGEASRDLLDALDDPIEEVLAAPPPPDAAGLFESHMSTWGETYLSTDTHIPRRIELLGRLESRTDRLGPMEAEILVFESVRGSPQRVRDAASRVLERFASQPTVVNAMLEALPMMPRTERNAGLVELVSGSRLPRPDAPDWAHEARRALVERLLELIAGHGLYARLDALAALLDEAYELNLDATPGSPISTRPPEARTSTRASADRWGAAAANRPPAGLPGLSVDEIVRRRSARLASADGLIQEFHAEQLALGEFMALVIVAEQPDLAGRVEAMLEFHRVARDRARNVLLQIAHTERFMLALWLLRYGHDT